MHHAVSYMMNFFAGFDKAYGQYDPKPAEQSPEGKLTGPRSTKKGKITAEMWHKHLMGEIGLGVVPINAESKVKFGAIDIDKYDINPEPIFRKINLYKLPIVPVRSKSGGLHLYLFMSDWTPAEPVQRRLKEIASLLGYGGSEVFPKQTSLLADRGDIGSWINVPYCDSVQTKRYSYSLETYKRESIDQFIEHVGKAAITLEVLEALKFEIPEKIEGGPPCLQRLLAEGFPTGTRNKGLFNLGVYAKKRDPDGWQALLENLNTESVGLPAAEVLGLIGSLRKKDYNYTCNESPIVDYCDRKKCRACRYGIGGNMGMPAMGSLTKIESDETTWFVQIEDGGRLELNTEELQNPRLFQKKCMDFLNIMPAIPKREEWEGVIQDLMKDVHIIKLPSEVSLAGRLLEHVEAFATSKVRTNQKDGLLVGKPYHYDHRIHFRMKDLLAYLERQRFNALKPHKIAYIIKEQLEGEHSSFNIGGACIQCWSIPEYHRQEVPLSLPDDLDKPLEVY